MAELVETLLEEPWLHRLEHPLLHRLLDPLVALTETGDETS